MSNIKPKTLIMKPITNQILWDMSKLITDRQKKASETDTSKVDWTMLEEDWFNYLEEMLTILSYE